MRRDDPGRHSGWDEGMRERVVVKEVPVERVVEKEVRVEVPKIVLQPIDVVREITVEVVNEVPKEIVREVPIIEIREVEVEVMLLFCSSYSPRKRSVNRCVPSLKNYA